MTKNKFTKRVLSIVGLFTFFLLSCAKETPVTEPLYGLVYLTNTTGSKIDVITGDNKSFDWNALHPTSLPAGKNRFRFYDTGALLLDTTLVVEPVNKHYYVLFKPNRNSIFRIYDNQLNGFDKEIKPDSGSVKFSLANFSENFPSKVNIYITTSMVLNSSDTEVQVGEFLDVSGSFSAYHKIALGTSPGGGVISKFTFTVKDPNTQAVLTKTSIDLPKVLEVGANRLAGNVYLLYLKADNTPDILMSKL